MHARRIIQDLLQTECNAVHAKRRTTLALMVQASCIGHLGLAGIGRRLDAATALRRRIERCDRLRGNFHLNHEKADGYRAMAQRILDGRAQPAIVVDWSDLAADRSRHLLRAAPIVEGRAVVLYEEVQPMKQYGSPKVHERFLRRLRELPPPSCRLVLVADTGFRAAWFKPCNRSKFDWVGRIRNRDMIRPPTEAAARVGCKTLYPKATPPRRTEARSTMCAARRWRAALCSTKNLPVIDRRRRRLASVRVAVAA